MYDLDIYWIRQFQIGQVEHSPISLLALALLLALLAQFLLFGISLVVSTFLLVFAVLHLLVIASFFLLDVVVLEVLELPVPLLLAFAHLGEGLLYDYYIW